MSNTKTYSVRVIAPGIAGYEEYVDAVNPNQAQKIVESRVPSDYKVLYPREV